MVLWLKCWNACHQITYVCLSSLNYYFCLDITHSYGIIFLCYYQKRFSFSLQVSSLLAISRHNLTSLVCEVSLQLFFFFCFVNFVVLLMLMLLLLIAKIHLLIFFLFWWIPWILKLLYRCNPQYWWVFFSLLFLPHIHHLLYVRLGGSSSLSLFICLSYSLVHFKNSAEYFTRRLPRCLFLWWDFCYGIWF